MKLSAVNSLSVTHHKAREKTSEKEIAAIVLDLIKKIPGASRSDVIRELIGLGFSIFESTEALRCLEDNKEIFLEESSLFLKVILCKSLVPSEFQREQKQFQNAWIRAREEGG